MVDDAREKMRSCIASGDALGVQRLLRAGADPNGNYDAGLVRASPSHHIPTRFWSALHFAAYHGSVESARVLLAAGARASHPAGIDHVMSVIHVAALMDRPDVVTLLLAHGATPDPAAVVAATPHLRCLQLLVEAGGDATCAVQATVTYGHDEALRFLLERGADPRGTLGAATTGDRVVRSPRMTALDYGHLACVRLLRGRAPYRSLSDAAADGDLAEAKRWVADGASVNELDIYDRPALYWALLAANPELVTWLLDRGASMSTVGSLPGAAASAALRSGSPEVLAILRARGADWTGTLSDQVTKDDLTGLRWLLANVTFDLRERQHAAWRCADLDRVAALRLLIEDGVDPSDALATAALHGSLGVVELLVERGADPHAVFGGRTLLDLAVEGPDPDEAELVDASDFETPLARRLLAWGVTSRHRR